MQTRMSASKVPAGSASLGDAFGGGFTFGLPTQAWFAREAPGDAHDLCADGAQLKLDHLVPHFAGVREHARCLRHRDHGGAPPTHAARAPRTPSC